MLFSSHPRPQTLHLNEFITASLFDFGAGQGVKGVGRNIAEDNVTDSAYKIYKVREVVPLIKSPTKTTSGSTHAVSASEVLGAGVSHLLHRLG
jgi:hypothetical protein